MKGKSRGFLIEAQITLIAILLAFLVGGVIIALMGENPFRAYGALLQGAFGSPVALSYSLTKAVPLIFTGLAVAVATRCTVFNIGAEGQLLMGAMAAGLVGVYVDLPMVIHIPLCILAGAAAGFLWAGIAAALKFARNVHVVIATIMLNYVATFFVQYLVNGPFKEENSTISGTARIAGSAQLPLLFPRPMSLNIGFILAIIMIFVCWFLLKKTTAGYELRAVGLNANASRTSGINIKKNMFLALLIRGALAGIGGAVEVQGSIYRVVDGFSPGYGFNGIPVAMMAHGNPVAVFFSAFLLGAMRNGALNMQIQVGVSQDIVDIIQGLVLIFLGCDYMIRYYLEHGTKKGGKADA